MAHKVTVVGVPLDENSSFLRRPALAPARIRTVLHAGAMNLTTEEGVDLGARPIVIKDFVKSRKHEWDSACYIPSTADDEAVERVVRRFLELQGDDLNEGLVFREFVALEPLAIHAKSGMPLTKEWRVFFLNGMPILTAEYWETGDYGNSTPPLAPYVELAQHVRSRFFTMDIARQTNGDWTVIELGDGQVAGLPERADVVAFYRALQQGMDGAHSSTPTT